MAANSASMDMTYFFSFLYKIYSVNLKNGKEIDISANFKIEKGKMKAILKLYARILKHADNISRGLFFFRFI